MSATSLGLNLFNKKKFSVFLHCSHWAATLDTPRSTRLVARFQSSKKASCNCNHTGSEEAQAKEHAQQRQRAMSCQEQELAPAPLCWLHLYGSIHGVDEVDPKLAFLVITSFKSANSIVAKRGSKHELKISSCPKYRVELTMLSAHQQ